MAKKNEAEEQVNVSKDEQIGFHKGALSTLAKEREELLKMVNICEQLMQMHVKGLQELGVDLQKQAEEAAKVMKDAKTKGVKTDKKIDELL